MSLCRLVLLALTFAACSGGEPAAPAVDAPDNLPACTNATYDPCTSNAECDSNDCHLFNGEFQVCQVPCTPLDDSTCPLDATGIHGKCNMRGFCKPSTPNACER